MISYRRGVIDHAPTETFVVAQGVMNHAPTETFVVAQGVIDHAQPPPAACLQWPHTVGRD